jgi:hypothetical protein
MEMICFVHKRIDLMLPIPQKKNMDDFWKSSALDSVRQEVKNFGFLICNRFAVAIFAAPAVTP